MEHSPIKAQSNVELDASSLSYDKSQSRVRRAAGHIATGKARMPGVDLEAEAADAVFDLLDVQCTGLVSPALHPGLRCTCVAQDMPRHVAWQDMLHAKTCCMPRHVACQDMLHLVVSPPPLLPPVLLLPCVFFLPSSFSRLLSPLPSPTLSPTHPVPRALLTLCPGLHI